MSNAARKARKAAHQPFVREAKVGTPIEERAENQPRPDRKGKPVLKLAARKRIESYKSSLFTPTAKGRH